MDRIIRLDSDTVNQIAAGEVVERPASVVKELVENAIDAGARRIVIECLEAGKRLVRVTDDGAGMTRTDAMLALERHTTSKLRTIEELEGLVTLGFRGEALPSIAGVARLEILSRPHDQLSATKISVEPGQPIQVEETAGPPGTSVAVRDLFFNVPARAKFLRSHGQELSQVSDTVTRLALAYPQVRFQLVHEQRVLINTSGSGDLRSAAAEVWGKDRVQGMVPIEWRSPEGIAVTGFAGAIDAAGGSRRYQIYYVNGRWIRSGPLRYGVDEGYRGVLPAGRFSPVLLFVQLPGRLVDINVHPCKWEARFWNDRAVQAIVAEALREALGQPFSRTAGGGGDALQRNNGGQWHSEAFSAGGELAARLQQPLPVAAWSEQVRESEEAPAWEWLGQVYRRYILAYDGQRLFAVDQHAAAERLCYLKLSAGQRSVAQTLLQPQSIELSGEQVGFVQEHLSVLGELGFGVEVFGDRALLVRAIPASLGGVPVPQLLNDVLDRLTDVKPGGLSLQEARRAVAACHAALRSGQRLSSVEMHALLRELQSTEPPYVCPHGRPVLLELGLDELDKKFGR